MLGHRPEYKITEIYARYAADYLGDAAKAIGEYFQELQPRLNRRFDWSLRNCALVAC